MVQSKIHKMENQNLSVDGINVNRALSFQDEKKNKWTDELIIASRELAFQNEESEKPVTELS